MTQWPKAYAFWHRGQGLGNVSDMVVTPGLTQRDSDLLRGVLDTAVLALIAIEPCHAYAIVERLRTAGLLSVGYGTIYPLVTRLRRNGLVAQEPAPSPEGPDRFVLTITLPGREALLEWRTRWELTTSAVGSILDELDSAERGHG